jgi:hypothetical protein
MKLVTPTGELLALKPLNHETVTRLGLVDWLVTLTTVAERILPAVWLFM